MMERKATQLGLTHMQCRGGTGLIGRRGAWELYRLLASFQSGSRLGFDPELADLPDCNIRPSDHDTWLERVALQRLELQLHSSKRILVAAGTLGAGTKPSQHTSYKTWNKALLTYFVKEWGALNE